MLTLNDTELAVLALVATLVKIGRQVREMVRKQRTPDWLSAACPVCSNKMNWQARKPDEQGRATFKCCYCTFVESRGEDGSEQVAAKHMEHK